LAVKRIGVVALDGLRLADRLVDDLGERRGRVNRDAVLRGVFSGAMQTHDEGAFRRACAELVFRQLIESPVQSLRINL